MLDNLPVQTAQVYDYLSKGNFLCSNTSVKELKTLFLIVEENFELLRDYFMYINFVLEQGNNYFYFSRKEPRATLEQKLQRFYAWIDVMDSDRDFLSLRQRSSSVHALTWILK